MSYWTLLFGLPIDLPTEEVNEMLKVSFPSVTKALKEFLDNGDMMVVASLPDRERFFHFNHHVHKNEAIDGNGNSVVRIFNSSQAYETYARLQDKKDLDDLSDVIFPRVLDYWKEAGIEFRNLSKPWSDSQTLDYDDIGGFILPKEAIGFKTQYNDFEYIVFKSNTGVWTASTNKFTTNVWYIESLEPLMKAFEVLLADK